MVQAIGLVPFNFVRVEGLEPPCREALDPKSSVSTNFTTPAINKDLFKRDCKDNTV